MLRGTKELLHVFFTTVLLCSGPAGSAQPAHYGFSWSNGYGNQGLACSDDGRFVAIAHMSGLIDVRETATLRHVRTLLGSTGRVDQVAFSPDGATVYSSMDMGYVHAWSLATGKIVRKYEGSIDICMGLDASADGRLVAAGNWHSTLYVWDAATGVPMQTVPIGARVVDVSFSPDCVHVAVSSFDGTVKIVDVTTGLVVKTIADATTSIWSVAYSRDGTKLVTGGEDRMIYVWDAQAGTRLLTVPGSSSTVETVAFSLDGTRILSTSGSTTSVWDAFTGALLWSYNEPLFRSALVPAFIGASYCAVVSGTSGLKVYDTVSGVRLAALETDTNASVATDLSPSGTIMATGSTNSYVCILDARTGFQTRAFAPDNSPVYALKFSSDGSLLVTGSGKIRFWKTSDWSLVRTLAMSNVRCMAVSPDGSMVACGQTNGKNVYVIDSNTGAVIATLTGHTANVKDLAFSPDGTILASCAEGIDSTCRLWSTSMWTLLRTLSGQSGGIHTVSFSPDGSLVATGSGNKTLRTWSTADGTVQREFVGHTDAVVDSAFDPGSQFLHSCSIDGTVRCWNVVQGSQVAKTSNLGTTRAIALNPRRGTVVFAGDRSWGALSMVRAVGP